VFENRVLRKILGPRRHEVTGEWRKLHIEELNNLHSSPSIVWVIKSRRMRWVGYVERMGERRCVSRVLVGKPEGKGPLGRPRHRWEDNIKIDLQKVGCVGLEWIELDQLVNVVTNLRVL
jgi:3-oxoacyl-ACP reductase-like protein